MKLFALFLVSSQAQRKTCFTCEAGSLSECQAKGKDKMCWKNQDSCFVQERLRNGIVEKVNKNSPIFKDERYFQKWQNFKIYLQDSQSQD